MTREKIIRNYLRPNHDGFHLSVSTCFPEAYIIVDRDAVFLGVNMAGEACTSNGRLALFFRE
jgi:hypothetical protein